MQWMLEILTSLKKKPTPPKTQTSTQTNLYLEETSASIKVKMQIFYFSILPKSITDVFFLCLFMHPSNK